MKSITPAQTAQNAEADFDQKTLSEHISAQNNSQGYFKHAFQCGLRLKEKQRRFAGPSGSIHGRNQYSPGESFGNWLERIEIPKSTAYFYISLAERVLCGIYRKDVSLAGELPPAIEVESKVISFSACLTMPETELPAEAVKFRQAVCDFIADPKSVESVRAGLEGKSSLTNVSRVANGKLNGGAVAGDNRKEVERFIPKKFEQAANMLCKFKIDSSGNKRLCGWRKFEKGPEAEIITESTTHLGRYPRFLLKAFKSVIDKELSYQSEDDRLAHHE